MHRAKPPRPQSFFILSILSAPSPDPLPQGEGRVRDRAKTCLRADTHRRQSCNDAFQYEYERVLKDDRVTKILLLRR